VATEYTLSSVLPVMRDALRESDEFTFDEIGDF
jgi:hypothetical protein